MGVVLALASSACYGLSDLAGGLLSRRASFFAVAFAGQVSALLLTLLAAPPTSAAVPTSSDIGWGLLSGAGTGLGMMFLFRGLSQGAMSVVVPVSAVGGVALPVLVGIAALGERPSLLAWLGITVAVPALWLVSRPRSRDGAAGTAGAVNGLIASAGFALQYIALAQAGPDAGIWPVTAGRVTAVLTVVALAKPTTRAPLSVRMPLLTTLGAAATGGSAALALIFYLLAARQQLVVIAVVLSSLYPVAPTLLGITALRERVSWPQTIGLVAAGAAISLITIG